MTTDYYADAARVAVALATEGFVSEAMALQEVMEAGATSTEILMGIRWQLSKIVHSGLAISRPTLQTITQLLGGIDSALK